MPGSDGSIVINTEIDNKNAQKELNRLEKQIKSLEEQLTSKKQGRLPLEENLNAVSEKLEKARKDLAIFQDEQQAIREAMQPGASAEDYIRAYSDQEQVSSALKQQQGEVNAIEKEWQAAKNKLTEYDAKTGELAGKLNKAKEEAGGIQKAINASSKSLDSVSRKARGVQKALSASSKPLNSMPNAVNRMNSGMERFSKRLSGVVSSALIFTVVSQGLAKLRDWFGSVIQANDETSAAIKRLKAALLTMIQPLMNIVLPAFTMFTNLLTRLATVAGNLLSKLFGTTFSESAQAAEELYNQTNKATKANEKYKKSLAGFDEINQLSTSQDGGAAAEEGSSPDFKGMMQTQINGIVELFTGVALLALGAILTFSGAHIFLGIGLMIVGALAVWDAVSTNWGAIQEQLQGPLGVLVGILGGSLLVIGAILCFSGAAIPLGIGLMIIGAAALAVTAAANWDSIVTALQGPIGILVGILGGVLLVIGAILCFSGANIGLGIGLMIVGAATLATVAAINWDSIVSALQGPIGVLMGVLGGATLVLGAILAFTGAALPLGIGLMIVGAATLATVAAVNWDSIVSALQGPIGTIVGIVGGALIVLGVILCFSGVGIPLGIALIAAGAASLVTVIAVNWNSIVDSIKGVWNNIKNWWNTYVAKYFTADYWAELGRNMINGLISMIETGINWIIDKINWFIGKVNGGLGLLSHIGIDLQIPTIPKVNLPRLATGAVIPPNREFMAVLGDQKRGTNIETPEDLLRQIVSEESGGAEIISLLQAILEATRQKTRMYVDKKVLAETAKDGINDMTIAAGRSVLLY